MIKRLPGRIPPIHSTAALQRLRGRQDRLVPSPPSSAVTSLAAAPFSIGRTLQNLAPLLHFEAFGGISGQRIYLVIEIIDELCSRLLRDHSVTNRLLNCASVRRTKTYTDGSQFLVSSRLTPFIHLRNLRLDLTEATIQLPAQPGIQRT